jgi:hypothetical protein
LRSTISSCNATAHRVYDAAKFDEQTGWQLACVQHVPLPKRCSRTERGSSATRNPSSRPRRPQSLLPVYKGFHALQWHCTGHWLWRDGRRELAHFLQSRASEVFAVDIHPAVPIGRGVFIDHGTGLVVGETADIGDDVSILLLALCGFLPRLPPSDVNSPPHQ